MAKKTKKKINFRFAQMDPILFNVVLVLLCFGLIMCFSASAPSAQFQQGDSYYFLKKQLIWAVCGLIAMFFMANFSYKKLEKLSGLIVIVSLALLGAVLLMPSINGAKRWFGIGGASFQPSEVAKLAVIIWFAHKLSKQSWEKASYIKDFCPYLLVLAIYAGLLMLEPHFSCTILIFLTAMVMLFVSGAKISHFGITALPVIPAVLYLAFSGGYRASRITTFLNPFNDPSGDGWQIIQSLYAIGSGGLFGLGLGQSRQKFLYIPEPQNDFIFSVLCEELGFIGAAVVISLFLVLIWRGIYIAINAPDKFSCLLAVGITALIAIQVVINVAVVTSSMPVTGMPLPFFSAGGSSLVFVMAAMGILLNISKQIHTPQKGE